MFSDYIQVFLLDDIISDLDALIIEVNHAINHAVVPCLKSSNQQFVLDDSFIHKLASVVILRIEF